MKAWPVLSLRPPHPFPPPFPIPAQASWLPTPPLLTLRSPSQCAFLVPYLSPSSCTPAPTLASCRLCARSPTHSELLVRSRSPAPVTKRAALPSAGKARGSGGWAGVSGPRQSMNLQCPPGPALDAAEAPRLRRSYVGPDPGRQQLPILSFSAVCGTSQGRWEGAQRGIADNSTH